MGHPTAAGFDASVVNRGDFNNDGIPDVVTGNNSGTSGNGVSVNLGIGDGRFQSALNSASGIGTFDMAVGDFNGDGKLDVALAGYNSPSQMIIQIMLGKGDGTFTKGQTINLASGLNATSITAADMDGDGKLDLATTSTANNKVYFYKGSGTGTFSSAGSKAVGSSNISAVSVRVGDFNADGKVDLVVSKYSSLYVLWNNGGNFNFTPVQVASAPYGVFGTPVDVNQDHFTDLIVTKDTCQTGNTCVTWEVLLGSATKTFKQSASVVVSGYQSVYPTIAADVNGDGINDIVGIGTQSQLLIWLGNPDGSYTTTPLAFFIGSAYGATDLVASDFNRDGKIDFATPSGAFLNATPRNACTPYQVSPAVTVCQPQDLTYSNSPVQWIADTVDTSANVTTMQVYVDNKLVVNNSSSSLNEPLTMSNGPHSVVTKAWDASGANFRSDRNITIYSGTPGETCAATTNAMTICMPTQNETTGTSLHVFANADSAANQITSVQVYIDGSLIYNDTSGATYVDTSLTVAKGPHSVVIKAWDANGNAFSDSRNITAQ